VQPSLKNAPFCAVFSLYFVEDGTSVELFKIGTEFATSNQQKNQSKGVGHRQDGSKVCSES